MDLASINTKVAKIREIYDIWYNQSRGYTDRDIIILDELYNLWRIGPWEFLPFHRRFAQE